MSTLNPEHHQLAEAAVRLAAQLPQDVLLTLATAVNRLTAPTPQSLRQRILQGVPTPGFREATAAFLDEWQRQAPGVSAEAVAMVLVTAARSEKRHQRHAAVELVWTGPDVGRHPFRQTEQAILEVIDSAELRLTIASYAVYRIPRIRDALVAAAARGVQIQVIVETPNRVEGQGEYDSLRALGANVAAACAVYYWPQANRPRDENGKIGILHVKCAVADGHRLFLSSANFTEYAFTINLELGLLVTGGRLPLQVAQQFDELIQLGQLWPV